MNGSARDFIGKLLLVAFVSFFITSCGSIKQEPFEEFAKVVSNTQSGINYAMNLNYNLSEEKFINDFSSKPQADLVDLRIKSNGYEWTLNKKKIPTFLAIKHARTALFSLNDSILQYVILLKLLSSDKLISSEAFDLLKKSMNDCSNSSIKALGLKVPPESTKIISGITADSIRLYLKHKQKKYLIDAIKNGQVSIAFFSKLCKGQLGMIRNSIVSHYDSEYSRIIEQWDDEDNKDLKNAEVIKKRKSLVKEMIALDLQLIDIMSLLKELSIVYRELPRANADLAECIDNPKKYRSGLQKLFNASKRLEVLNKTLSK